MDCWIVMAGGNYKILPRRPIGLPWRSRFSTLSTVGSLVGQAGRFRRAGRRKSGQHRRQLTCHGAAPKTRHQFRAVGTEMAGFREKTDA
jgi:hypothetical protein